jgi:predicted metal-dependent phosphotriesterase family hydrolase
MWTDMSQVEYMGVLLHTVQLTRIGFEKQFCLACMEVDTIHVTAAVVKQYVEATLQDFGRPVKAIFRVVHDADAKVIKGVRDAGVSSLLCYLPRHPAHHCGVFKVS